MDGKVPVELPERNAEWINDENDSHVQWIIYRPILVCHSRALSSDIALLDIRGSYSGHGG